MKAIIVAPNASARGGGESIIPLHYFNFLSNCGVSTFLVVHSRSRDEIDALFADKKEDVYYVEDTRLQKILFLCGRRLPKRISSFFTGFIIDIITQREQRKLIRKLVAEKSIDIVHQPIRVSPKLPSLIHNVGAPVIIGPMNGGMTFPSAYQDMQGRSEKYFMAFGRFFSRVFNLLFPGKKYAKALLVANQRTAGALPRGLCSNVIELVENGVDLNIFKQSDLTELAPEALPLDDAAKSCRFIFVGRLVDWKCVDVLLRAIKILQDRDMNVFLDIVGMGEDKLQLEELATSLDLGGRVNFLGFKTQVECAQLITNADCLVLPSVYECGGAVVLEAMAMGKPVIASNWGGPADYLDASCGILVDIPKTKEAFVEQFAEAMAKISCDPENRHQLGKNGLDKVKVQFDWARKVEKMKSIYLDVLSP
ncbi:glycosyltransferase family 4 protein [Marinagarivorans cellulosilyticus]|uniref:Glycosyl transferase family 1 domain-containing protein n=1 Tax=Marinagarivorans cellulosilyticus TaxID=2721545 RepID=A0AAN2BJ67_9GAMM|nr:glycosyltransferase family 4 protein [Marinagarivorans cellulosilyticus]BCD96647.1 hypothetical protein MARGE09_P0847 [Marinagarivorans cellulosilyticus]